MNTQEVITTRKSIRAYTSEQLTEAELSTILDAAYAAPVAGGAYKKMRLTVVQRAAMLNKISAAYQEAGTKADMLFGAPTLIIVSGGINACLAKTVLLMRKRKSVKRMRLLLSPRSIGKKSARA